MWFPPYDLQVDEASTANWTTNNFLGRPEPIYSYNNTDRTGTLRFKIVVDHASVLNMLVRRELKKLTDEEVNGIVDSFHAGCKKYDIYDLARKWNLGITVIQEIETIINSADVDQATISEISDGTNTSDPQIIEDVYDSGPLIAFASPSLSFYFTIWILALKDSIVSLKTRIKTAVKAPMPLRKTHGDIPIITEKLTSELKI